MQLWIYEEDKKGRDGYVFKFDTLTNCTTFVTKMCPLSPPSTLTNRTHDESSNTTNNMDKNAIKTTINPTAAHQSQLFIAEFNKLIIYCQGVKLKEYNINKAQDLLGKFIIKIL
jgi:hypothetical protein